MDGEKYKFGDNPISMIEPDFSIKDPIRVRSEGDMNDFKLIREASEDPFRGKSS